MSTNYLRNKISGDIYPFSSYLLVKGEWEPYEPLMSQEEKVEEPEVAPEVITIVETLPDSILDKELVETILDKPITVKQYKKATKGKK